MVGKIAILASLTLSSTLQVDAKSQSHEKLAKALAKLNSLSVEAKDAMAAIKTAEPKLTGSSELIKRSTQQVHKMLDREFKPIVGGTHPERYLASGSFDAAVKVLKVATDPSNALFGKSAIIVDVFFPGALQSDTIPGKAASISIEGATELAAKELKQDAATSGRPFTKPRTINPDNINLNELRPRNTEEGLPWSDPDSFEDATVPEEYNDVYVLVRNHLKEEGKISPKRLAGHLVTEGLAVPVYVIDYPLAPGTPGQVRQLTIFRRWMDWIDSWVIVPNRWQALYFYILVCIVYKDQLPRGLLQKLLNLE